MSCAPAHLQPPMGGAPLPPGPGPGALSPKLDSEFSLTHLGRARRGRAVLGGFLSTPVCKLPQIKREAIFNTLLVPTTHSLSGGPHGDLCQQRVGSALC